MALKTHGTMAVDWEQRIDFDRLRDSSQASPYARAFLFLAEQLNIGPAQTW